MACQKHDIYITVKSYNTCVHTCQWRHFDLLAFARGVIMQLCIADLQINVEKWHI